MVDKFQHIEKEFGIKISDCFAYRISDHPLAKEEKGTLHRRSLTYKNETEKEVAIHKHLKDWLEQLSYYHYLILFAQYQIHKSTIIR